MSSPRLTIRLLGGFTVLYDGEPLDINFNKENALLVYLAYYVGTTPHSRAHLANLLWDNKNDATAAQNFRKNLERLERWLGGDDTSYLARTKDTVILADNKVTVDVKQFRDALTRCKQHHQPDSTCKMCLAAYQEAASIYRGAFLDQCDFSLPEVDSWVSKVRASLHWEAVAVLEFLSKAYSNGGQYALAERYTRRLLEIDPYHEPAQQRRLRLLMRQGKRHKALIAYSEMVDELRQDGFAPSSELRQLAAKIRNYDGKTPHNLRSPIRLIGRHHDKSVVRRNLLNPAKPLLTLVGIGGVGKTSLALAVAQSLVREKMGIFMDGVCFISLNETRTNDTSTIINALIDFFTPQTSGQLRDHDVIIRHLRDKDCLIIIDNAEGLSHDAKRFLLNVLERASGVTFLITSREKLNLSNTLETEHAVDGLAFPAPEVVPPVSTSEATLDAFADDYAAIELLLERAHTSQAAAETWQALRDDDTERRAVIRITQLTQGLSLALEMAAAWVGMYTFQIIADDIARSLDLLSSEMTDVPDRQRSIRAVFDYSWSQLTADEQDALMRLTVFPDSFTPDAAESITDISIRTTLRSLVDKSLVGSFKAADGQPRFALHPLLRQFLREQETAIDMAALEAAHMRYYATFITDCIATQAQQHLADAAAQQFASEYSNLQAGWRWLLRHNDDYLAEMQIYIKALHQYLMRRSLYNEGINQFEAARDALQPLVEKPMEADPQTLLVSCQVSSRLASFYLSAGQPQAAEQANTFAMQHATRLEDADAIAHIYKKEGEIHRYYGEYEQAKEDFTMAIQAADMSDNPGWYAHTLMALGAVELRSNHLADARDYFQRSIRQFHDLTDTYFEGYATLLLAHAYAEQDDIASARQYSQQALLLFESIDANTGMAMVYREESKLARENGDMVQAFTHLQTADDLLRPQDVLGKALLELDTARYYAAQNDSRRAHAHALACFRIAAKINQITVVQQSLLQVLHHYLRVHQIPPTYEITQIACFIYATSEKDPRVRPRVEAFFAAHLPDAAMDSGSTRYTLDQLEALVERRYSRLPDADTDEATSAD